MFIKPYGAQPLLAVAIARDGTLDAKSPLASGSPCIGLKKRRRSLICLLYYHTTCIKVIVRFLIIRIENFSYILFFEFLIFARRASSENKTVTKIYENTVSIVFNTCYESSCVTCLLY